MLDSDTKNMISVWIGTSYKTLDEFNKYTEGIGRHRPWEKKSTDTSWKDRF